VSPETLLAWHRKLIAQKYTAVKGVDRGDRVPSMRSRRWSSDWLKTTRDWGYRRIHRALSNLGHEIARSTIADILQCRGIEPAPERKRKTTIRPTAGLRSGQCRFAGWRSSPPLPAALSLNTASSIEFLSRDRVPTLTAHGPDFFLFADRRH